jgi:hypothetical protein
MSVVEVVPVPVVVMRWILQPRFSDVSKLFWLMYARSRRQMLDEAAATSIKVFEAVVACAPTAKV